METYEASVDEVHDDVASARRDKVIRPVKVCQSEISRVKAKCTERTESGLIPIPTRLPLPSFAKLNQTMDCFLT